MAVIASTKEMKRIMGDYFKRFLDHPPVAWCTSVGPAELLRAFGFEVYFPENHGALLGATRLAGDYIPDSVQEGFAGDICSYLTSDIGAYLNKRSPLMEHYGLPGIPKPDLIVFSTNQCREVQDWFTWFANEFDCPVFGIYPPRHVDEVDESAMRNVIAQYHELVGFCEKVTGKKFDDAAFAHTTRLSKEAAVLWRKVLETAANRPAPISFFDGCIHMGPMVVLRGTQEAVDYYQGLLNELEGHIAAGESAVEGEQVRIYWDGMPIWGKLRRLSGLFAANKAAIVASTYCNSWVFDTLDENDPFASSARAYTSIFINRSEKAKMEMMKQMLAEYKVDGVIFHDARTCFNNSNARFSMPQRLEKETGLPSMVLEGDLCDLRFYSEDQSEIKLEAFIDQLKELKPQIA